MVKQVGNSNWYELSDGTKVQGKAKAEAAEAALAGSDSTSRYGAPYAEVTGQERGNPGISRYGAPYAEVAQSE